MEIIISALTSAITILLVGLILPWVVSVQQKSEKETNKDAIANKSICYDRYKVISMRILSGAAFLLTLAALVGTILYIVVPEIMEKSNEDIEWMIFCWVLCVALDVLTIVFAIKFTRKIIYNEDSFTDIRVFRKKRQHFYKNITKIENTIKTTFASTIKITYESKKGNLKIYFGEKCVKIPATMCGINEFIILLHTKCPNLTFA